MTRRHPRRGVRAALAALAVTVGTSCSSGPGAVEDYEAFYDQAPFTVAVLPVINRTVDADAPRYFLSTIAKPLIDRGYYVLPVQATAEILAAEGLGEGGVLADVAPQKFGEYFGADAVLRITLTTWDTSYVVLASSVSVGMSYELVSTRTGQVLWHTQHQETIQSGSGGGGLAGLIAGAINAATVAATTDYVPMARAVNAAASATLPPGPYDPAFEKKRAEHLERARQQRADRESADRAAASATGQDG